MFGLGFFFWWTSARKLQKPLELTYGPDSSLFLESLGPLLGAEFTTGNTLTPLVNGDQYVPAMLEAIRGAKKTITLESYIWSSGKMSDQFIEALGERARNGVKVHVLVDGVGIILFSAADQKRLTDAGVQYVLYGRPHWYSLKLDLNHRTHRKLLIVDGQIGFTGGMCVDDHWLGNAQSPEVWRETQVRVQGPVVRQMQAIFATNWLETTAQLLIGPDYFPVQAWTEKGSFAQCYKSGPNEDPENARISYLYAIASARKSIRISHGYFVPDDLAIQMLIAARKRGVKIEVIVPEYNDSRFGRAASRSRWAELLANGVEFYRYQPAMYHCKMMVIDDLFVTIGSVNFDNRSFGINDEVNLNVVDPAFAHEGNVIFDNDLKGSKRLTLEVFEHRPFYIKWLDHLCGLFRSQL